MAVMLVRHSRTLDLDAADRGELALLVLINPRSPVCRRVGLPAGGCSGAVARFAGLAAQLGVNVPA